MNPVAHAQASARVLKHGVVKYSSLVVGLKITAVVTVVLSLGVTLLVYERCVHTPGGLRIIGDCEKGLLSFARARPNVLSALCCSY